MLDKITKKIEGVVGQLPVTHDIKLQIESTLRTVLDEMNVVMREELEVQETRLNRAQSRIESLEARLSELEEKKLKG